MDLDKLTKELLLKKAEENNTIDLNAYAIGMADLKKQLALCNVVGRSEQFYCFDEKNKRIDRCVNQCDTCKGLKLMQ